MAIKPGRWAISAGAVDPRFQHLWRGLELLVPLWEGADPPYELISGLPFVKNGAQVSQMVWESNQLGQGVVIPGWAASGDDGFWRIANHPVAGKTSDEMTFLSIANPVLFHGAVNGGVPFGNRSGRGGLENTGGGGNPITGFHWDGATQLDSAPLLEQTEGEASGDVVFMLVRWRRPGKPEGICFINGEQNRGGFGSTDATTAFLWDARVEFGDTLTTTSRGYGANFVLNAAWSRHLGDGEVALLQRDPFAMLRMSDSIPILAAAPSTAGGIIIQNA